MAAFYSMLQPPIHGRAQETSCAHLAEGRAGLVQILLMVVCPVEEQSEVGVFWAEPTMQSMRL
jgi:hypothetical protein